MDVFEQFGEWVSHDILRLAPAEHLGEAVSFFAGDIVKVTLLLAVMVFIVAIIRTYVTPKRIKKMLGGSKEGIGNVLAALLGVPTPFCSCSAVPLFIGLVESGVPLGVTFSFLIASPMVNEVAIAMLLGLVGWQVTLIYILSGLTIAIVAGIVIGRLGLEKEVEDFAYRMHVTNRRTKKNMKAKDRIKFAMQETREIVSKVFPYIAAGIALGAFIHGYVPVGFLSDIAGKDNALAVPIAVLIGIPLYSNAAGVIPIVQALMSKGMALGTALAFMMSVTALSLPEMIILRKVLKPKLIFIFAAILFLCITATGLLFNFILSGV